MGLRSREQSANFLCALQHTSRRRRQKIGAWRPVKKSWAQSVSMNPRIHNTAVKIGVGGSGSQVGLTDCIPAALAGLQLVRFPTWGSAFGSTPGYIPAAASRLWLVAISPGANVPLNTLEREFPEGPAAASTLTDIREVRAKPLVAAPDFFTFSSISAISR